MGVPEWDDFKKANDLGLSLAVAHRNGLVTLKPEGAAYVEESHASLLEVLNLEGVYEDLASIFDAAKQ